MKENGSMCQVEQLPRGCLLEPGLNGRQSQSYKHNSRISSSTVIRNRANGPVKALCSTPECGTSIRLECTEQIRRDGGGEKVLVTGGAGFFGFRLGKALARQGINVILLDLYQPRWELPDRAVFLQGDVRDHETLYKVCSGVDCIFHTASYGMSGPEQLRKEKIESVNVGGTNNIINVCCERGVSRLVYTSTVNVVFAGKPIDDGDEDSVPCVPLDKHIDHYSRTKAIAEHMVLTANRRSVQGGGLLQTCVLRPSGIYGPEERRHLHRVMVNVERRLFSFTFGDPMARMNWVHVDNLVMAHILAAEGLTPEQGYIASGQTYFINDGESVNVFDWMTPLFERLGYTRPLIRLPVSLVYLAAFLMEQLHLALRPVMEIPLLLTRNEVRNIAVSHTFKIEKARQELGFSPKKYTLADSVDQYLQSRPVQSASSVLNSRSFLFVLMMMMMMMVLVGLLVTLFQH